MRISLIGRVRVEFDDGEIDETQLVGRQGRLFFAYLVAEHARPVPRDELAEALWGETPPVTWEKALTVLASKLRRLLAERGVAAPSLLTAAFGCYRLELPDGTWVDVLEAENAAADAERALDAGGLDHARARASVAASLLQRPFLPGEDGAWVEAKRRHLADVREKALATLADANLRAGDARAAVDAAEQLITLAPLRESGYRQLMDAQAAAGNRAEALGVYERCRQLLADELGAFPSPETESIYRRLLELPAAQGPRDAEPAGEVAAAAARPWVRARGTAMLSIAGLALAVAGAAAFALSGDGDADLPKLDAIASAACSTLQYDGPGSPQLLIVADLPLQHGWLETTTPMVNAITLAMDRRDYTAGSYRVGLQTCDDTREGNPNDEETCKANARTYVASASVIGVVGPLTSGCALLQIPILNEAPGGAIPIISPSATYVGLTRPSGESSDEPDSYYPTGRRNFARTIPTDDVQAAAGALVASDLGVRRVYTLDMGDPPSTQFVDYFLRAARTLGISAVGRRSWDLEQASAAGIAEAIAKSGADGVFLGVPSLPSSVGLLTALRARLGRDVHLIAPEVFDPKTALLAGAAAEGMTITQPGPSADDLPTEGKEFVAAYTARFGEKPTRFALAAAQAADVMLDAIAASDGSRASVVQSLFKTRVSNGILGSFLITPTGDTTLNAVAVHRIADGKVETAATVVVPDALVGPG